MTAMKWRCSLPRLSERYERKSVMITTNLVFSQWQRIFKDPMTTLAVSSDDQLQGPLLRSSERALDYIRMDRPKRRSSYIMAAIDRLVHHCIILDMMGVESYRVKEASMSQLTQQEDRQVVSNESPLQGESASFMRSSGKNA
jgi:DNA replication protein DnaC